MTAAPNLFDYAKSELSQDAFLSWLVAHADCEAAQPMTVAAKSFIAFLWDVTGREKAKLIQLTKRPPLHQVEKIDVFFEARVDNIEAVFLIEDKTQTSHHSNQLQRYRELFSTSHPAHEIVLIYLKTGFHFARDERASEHGYAVVDLDDVVKFLRQHKVDNEIYADYLARAERMLMEREKGIEMLRSPAGHKTMGQDFVQYTFIRQLAGRCSENIGGVAVHNGRSIGGAPWTHLRFIRFGAVYSESVGEVVFHRVDARMDDTKKKEPRKPRFYLSTRQYAVVKGKPEARTEKVKRLARYRQIFVEARKLVGSSLQFAKATTDNAGANESEIAVLFFDELTNSVEAVLKEMPAVHASFVALVRKEFGVGDGP
jgi:hypothetical protein